MKSVLLKVANLLACLWRLIPEGLRTKIIMGFFVLDSRNPDPADGLRRLLTLRDRLDLVTNERAMAYGQGEHPKHRLTDYHQFFAGHVQNGNRVLDVGCGYGAVARSVATTHPDCTVMGVDQDMPRLEQARSSDNPPNLSFFEGDATKTLPEGKWDVVILSNVLEHIVDRPSFLKALIASTDAPTFLIRVPMFERDWQMPLRRELGVNYYSDDDHKIEHTRVELTAEVESAGLSIDIIATPWGEFWAECKREVTAND